MTLFKRAVAGFAAAALLAGCANAPIDTVASLQSSYIAASAAEGIYISSGKANPAVVGQAEKYRLPAYNAIEPLVQAEETGTSPVTAAEIEAAQAAIAALTTYLAAQNITPKTGA